MAERIDISDLDKAAVLAMLASGAHPPKGMGVLAPAAGQPVTVEDARAALELSTVFDYVRGRSVKVDLTGDSFDPWLYDRDNGRGMAAELVECLRAGLTPDAIAGLRR